MIKDTSTSGLVNMSNGLLGCPHKLPCGICMLTSRQCPKEPIEPTINYCCGESHAEPQPGTITTATNGGGSDDGH